MNLSSGGHTRANGLSGCFEQWFSVSTEEPEIFRALCAVELQEFLVNPRRLLRGSDFLMRWSQGRWSEELILQAINSTRDFYAIRYGLSSVAPRGKLQDIEEYFDKLERARLGTLKRPDLLVFRRSDSKPVKRLLNKCGGVSELPFIDEEDVRLKGLLELCIMGIECENSLWIARKMPDFSRELQNQKWLGGKKGLPKKAVTPTVILKDEDRDLLKKWQDKHLIKIHVWHIFYDMAFGYRLTEQKS